MKKKVSNIMLVLICIMIIVYTVAAFILQWIAGYEISSQLTISFFSFWAVELASLSAIKTSKIKHGYNSEEEVFEEEEEEE